MCARGAGHPIIQYNTKMIYDIMILTRTRPEGACGGRATWRGRVFLLVQISDAFMKMGVLPRMVFS